MLFLFQVSTHDKQVQTCDGQKGCVCVWGWDVWVRAQISPRPPNPLPALFGFGFNALRPLSTLRVVFTSSWPWCFLLVC